MILRDYQHQIINDIRQSFATGRKSPIVVAPTGSGKTVIFCHIAHGASKKNNRVLILVHRKELLRQTSRALNDMDVDHGLIAAGMPFYPHQVQVASVQTLARRAVKLRWRPDLIIVDEAHHSTSGSTWGKVLDYYNTAMIGFTATPERLDGRGLGRHNDGFFDAMIKGPSVRELVDLGYLSPPVVYAPSTVDLSGIHSRAGDFAAGEIEEVIDKPRITGSAVSHYRQHCPSEPAIVFCATVRHAEHVAAEFQAGGYQAASIDGKLDDKTRKQRIDDLGSGRLNVLTSCEIISEGVDVPVISCAILLRPTQSLGLCMQQVGRALRIHPGKTRALILDHVGNSLRHGLPDQDRDWSLDAPKRAKKNKDSSTLQVRQCESCYHVHLPAPQCPECGFVYPVQDRKIEQVEGELVEATQEIIDLAQAKQQAKREVGKARTLEDLIALGASRGYKPGWARYVFNSRNR